jgi:hypothetical protein
MVRYTIFTKMKKILFSFLIASILITSLSLGAKPTFAQAQNNPNTGQWWRPTMDQFTKKVGTNVADGGSPANEIFGERYTYAQVVWIIHTLADLGVGDILVLSDASGASQFANGENFRPGLILSLAGYADTFSKKPASGIEYVAQKIEKINPVGTAYAQAGGYGYSSSLLPIQGLWLASRNAAYLLMTFVVVILALLVMLRQKISPQVVLTAQSALPRVAIALVAITFSYAIAGFIVDLGFVIQGVISGLMAAVIAKGGAGESIYIFNQVNNGVSSILAYAIAFVLSSFSVNGGIIQNFVNGGSPIMDTALNTVFSVGGTLDFLLGLIVAIFLIVALFRILFLLLMTYVKFILQVIAGPFVLLLSVLGVGGGLGGWVKGLVAQMSVFVAIGLLVMFGHVFFRGLVVGDQGIAFKFFTVNVSNEADLKMLKILDSEAIKGGIQLGLKANPALKPLADISIGLAKLVLERNEKRPVQDVYMGLDFSSTAAMRAHLREGSYVVVQIKDQTTWDWSLFQFNPATARIERKDRPGQPIENNYFVFSVTK